MKYDLFTSVDEMLAPDTLSALHGQAIGTVQIRTVGHESSRSGSQFSKIITDNGRGPDFILKRVSVARDWIMEVTNDVRCRSVTLWQSGLLDRLHPDIDHAIVACAYDDDGWAILMRDVTDDLLFTADRPTELDRAKILPVLNALAILHATFWNAADLKRDDLGLCAPYDYYGSLSPATAQKKLGVDSPAPERILAGSQLMPKYVTPELADLYAGLLADPQPLIDAVSRLPNTLVHGDFQANNLGLASHHDETNAIVLDWQFATVGLGTIDLSLFLDAVELPLRYTAVEWYRNALARILGDRFPADRWQEMLELGYVAHFICRGAFKALFTDQSASKQEATYQHSRLLWFTDQIESVHKWL